MSPTAPSTVLTNGDATSALRAEIHEVYTAARQRLVSDGYRDNKELERLASRMVEAYLAGRDGFLPVAR